MALCVGKHSYLSTLGGLFSPQVDISGCFPTQKAVIVYCLCIILMIHNLQCITYHSQFESHYVELVLTNIMIRVISSNLAMNGLYSHFELSKKTT